MTNKQLKALNRELESLERKWDLAQRKIKDAERYLSMQERLDKLTVGAPWREWAKDHQIDGARRIAHRGKLLLGDTMGLGKTLTAIAAMDMIRAMTAEVDEDHPLVIETN
jgi:SNF2 family DNA or RNA helicase